MIINIIVLLKIWLFENVIINWMNALADFLYLKKSKSMNYHKNLLYLATEKCLKLQKETQLNICIKISDQFVSKKKKKRKKTEIITWLSSHYYNVEMNFILYLLCFTCFNNIWKTYSVLCFFLFHNFLAW